MIVMDFTRRHINQGSDMDREGLETVQVSRLSNAQDDKKKEERMRAITNKGNWRFYIVGQVLILSINSSAPQFTRQRGMRAGNFTVKIRCSN